MSNMKGKTLVITGATKGIGKSVAEKFAANGVNIAFTYNSNKEIADEIYAVENELGKKGRVLVRYSGTQPLLRVMVEGPERTLTEQYCKRICSTIKTKI